jgi:hypothetical protein
MRGTFGERTMELERRVGEGDLVGVVGFSGPAAVPQHEFSSRFDPPSWRGKTRLNYTTPGTGPRFLSGPLFEQHASYFQRIADALYDPMGAREAMRRAVMDLKTAARRRVPREHGDLRGTATAVAVDDGRVYYRRRGQ